MGSGTGAVYRLLEGSADLAEAHAAVWVTRPPAAGGPQIAELLEDGFDPAVTALFQRCLVLGPAPELCLLSAETATHGQPRPASPRRGCPRAGARRAPRGAAGRLSGRCASRGGPRLRKQAERRGRRSLHSPPRRDWRSGGVNHREAATSHLPRAWAPFTTATPRSEGSEEPT